METTRRRLEIRIGSLKSGFLSRLESDSEVCFVGLAGNSNRGETIRFWRLEAGISRLEENNGTIEMVAGSRRRARSSIRRGERKTAENLRLEKRSDLCLQQLARNSNSRFAIRNPGVGGR